MREARIAASLLIDFLGYLSRQGFGAEQVCQAAQLDPRWAQEPNARLPASAMARLWTAGEALTGDPDLGLHSAESYNPGALSIVGYVILSCHSARDALDRLAHYAPLLNDGLQVCLVHEPGLTRCRFGPAAGVDSFLHHAPRQAMETLAAGIVLTLRRLARQPPNPLAVCFRHAAPTSLTEHHRLLGPAVHFDQPHNEVLYPAAALASGMLSADPALLAVLEADAQRRLAQLATQDGVSARVQALLLTRLKGEVPALNDIASALAMSERSVQRSLRDENTSYRELVDLVRKDLALAHLARPGALAAEVAWLLGFSEPSAFTRAFRRWTGASPSQFRAA